jgi:para-aminobenzoate synthetase component 1
VKPQQEPVKTKVEIPESLYELFRTEETGMLLTGKSETLSRFSWQAGFGVKRSFTANESGPVFENLKAFFPAGSIVFGHFCYDVKNSVEKLSSAHYSGLDFPGAFFFIPEKTFDDRHEPVPGKKDNRPELLPGNFSGIIRLKERTSKEKYISSVQALLGHIRRGDIYEINYCMEFYAEHVLIDPVAVFKKLDKLYEAPFSALYKFKDQWLICASPERFLKKDGSKIISQPIKGTRPRGKTPAEDEQLKKELLEDEKERSENVMIVDLVRNDLSRSAKKGSVKVDELFGIYTFRPVHQMISTVSAELGENIHPVDAIKNAFPMGSMTGAPKIRAMELAEEFEDMKRGLYSGAIGYFTPEMDFDFNVVIRSIQYNAATGYLSFMVGSAITVNADPEKEYQECLVKARTLFEALGLELKE